MLDRNWCLLGYWWSLEILHNSHWTSIYSSPFNQVFSTAGVWELKCLFIIICVLLPWLSSPTWTRTASLLKFVDHTQLHTTVGWTPLDDGSAHLRDLYLTTHTLSKDSHPCWWRDSNTQFQQSIDLWDRHKCRNKCYTFWEVLFCLHDVNIGTCWGTVGSVSFWNWFIWRREREDELQMGIVRNIRYSWKETMTKKSYLLQKVGFRTSLYLFVMQTWHKV
jgi:hypothetical protein